MNVQAQTVQAQTAAKSDAAGARFERKCKCGARAGIEGACPSCTAATALGHPMGLYVTEPDDAAERHADQTANQLAGPSRGQRNSSMRAPALTAPFARTLETAHSGGRQLPAGLRFEFEAGFGRDLSHVRLHDDRASHELSRSIQARAFAYRNHIFLSRDQRRSDRQQNRHLLAHEIAHVLQDGKSEAIRRQPDPDIAPPTASSERLEPDQVSVYALISYHEAAGMKTDYTKTPIGPLYPGDVLTTDVRAQDPEFPAQKNRRVLDAPVTWDLPTADLEIAKELSTGRHRLRVIADPASLAQPRDVQATLHSDAFNAPIPITFTLSAPPEMPSVVDPDGIQLERSAQLAENSANRQQVKTADAAKAARQGHGPTRRADRSARRDLRRDQRNATDEEAEARDFRQERRDLRAEQRKARKKRRQDLRGNRADLREARSEQRARAKDLRQFERKADCDLKDQRLIETALKTAITRAEAAISAIKPGAEPDKKTIASLKRFFKFDAKKASPDETTAMLQRILDVLNLARNGMLTATPDQFVCRSGGCDPTSGAFVKSIVRGKQVNVCSIWFTNKIGFEVTNGTAEAQAYALLHEFLHLSGVSTRYEEESEIYVNASASEWRSSSHEQRLLMADAFASFGWTIGQGGG